MNLPDQRQNQYAMLEHYLNIGRPVQVLNALKEPLQQDPTDPYLHYIQAYCYYLLDRFEEAIEALAESARYGYFDIKIYQLFGHIYTEMECWEEAERYYLLALRLDPNNGPLHASYGYLMLKTGHMNKAGLLMEEALKLSPNSSLVLRRYHLYQLARSSKKDQVLALEHYVQHADDEVALQIHLGLQELYQGHTKNANEHFIQAYVLDPTNPLLREMVEVTSSTSQPFFRPLEWADKIGGPKVVWFVGIGSILISRILGFTELSIVLTVIYLIYVIYSCVAVGVIKIRNRRSKR